MGYRDNFVYDNNTSSSTWTTKKIVKWVGLGFAALIVLSVVISSIYSISPGYRGVLVTLGKVSPHSYVNGVGFKIPFVSEMVKVDVRTKKMTSTAASYTSDIQTAELKFNFQYDLVADNVHVLYEKIGMDYENKLVIPVLNDVLKEVIGKWQAQELISNLDKARVEITRLLNERLDKNYFQNAQFLFENTDYSDAFEKAIEDKVIAEQKAQEAVNNTKRITEEANQQVISAKAEAEAMEIKSEALSKNKGLTEYEAVQKWDGKLPQYMLGNSVPFINLSGR